MKYYSTNKKANLASLQEAVVKGLAPDKGLYMPETINKLPKDFFEHIEELSFQEIAFEVAKAWFGDDVEHTELKKIVYDTLAFDVPAVKVEDNIYFLEGLGSLQLTKGANNTVEIKLTNLSGTIASGTAEDETVNVTDGKTLDLCRTWYIVQTNFRYEGFTADGKAETPVGAEFPNAQYQTSNDLMAMGEWLMQNYKKDIMEELAGKSYIKNIIFTPKTFAINFGYETYVGDWEWTNKDKGTINYEWEKGYMTTNFDNGEATVSFNDGYATLKLQGDIQSNRENKGTYKLTLTFTLSDKEPIEQPT